MELHFSVMDAFRFVAAVLVTVASGLALQLFVSRIRHREFSLLYLGLGAAAYASRLLLLAMGQVGTTPVLLLTLFLPIPLILFMVETVAPEWRKVAYWFIAANLAVAVFALGARILRGDLALSWAAIDIFSLIEIPLVIGMLFFPRRPPDRDLRVTRAGIIVFLLFAIVSNIQALVWRSGKNLEFIGFIISLACLADVALHRVLGNEERLHDLHKELEIARGIQAQLLPRPIFRIENLEVGSRYVPATSVAGDFYDFLANGDGLGVLIADVSGHGIPAALSASMVKVAVRAQMENADDPARVLYGMNSILHGNLQGQFVTAGYLFLNPARGTLTYAGAGHPPLLLWHSCSRKAETLMENGKPLGIFPDGSYKAKELPLAKGDRCVLYTDGLLEAPAPSGEEFGSERLMAFVAEQASLAPQALCDKLVARVSEWCGPDRQAHDDLTIVVVDVR